MRQHLFFAVAALSALMALPSHSSAQTLFGLRDNNSISIIDSANPAIATPGLAVNGLVDGESLVAIDYRPATGQVYGLGSSSTVYTIDQTSFSATTVGQFSPSFPDTVVGFDFNPAFMSGTFARIIGVQDDNRVISGNDGSYLDPVEKTDVFYDTGDANEGTNPNINAIAYTNSIPNSPGTQQYGIDSNLGVLVTVANNAGTLATVGDLGLGTNLGDEVGLDIDGVSGTAFANVGSNLYSVNLTTGEATSLGTVGSVGSGGLRDITAVPAAIPEPTALAFLGLAGVTMTIRRRKQIC